MKGNCSGKEVGMYRDEYPRLAVAPSGWPYEVIDMRGHVSPLAGVTVHLKVVGGLRGEGVGLSCDALESGAGTGGKDDSCISEGLGDFIVRVEGELDALRRDEAADDFLLVAAECAEGTYEAFLFGMVDDALTYMAAERRHEPDEYGGEGEEKDGTRNYAVLICTVGPSEWLKEYAWGGKEKPAGACEYPVCVFGKKEFEEFKQRFGDVRRHAGGE